MHAASYGGHLSVVEVLIRSHADINAIDKVSECVTKFSKAVCMHMYATTQQQYYNINIAIHYFYTYNHRHSQI